MMFSIGKLVLVLLGFLIAVPESIALAQAEEGPGSSGSPSDSPNLQLGTIPSLTKRKCHELRTQEKWPKMKAAQRISWIEANRTKGRRRVNYCLFTVTALQVKAEGVWTNTFASWESPENVLLQDPEVFVRIQGGYVNKKLIRDIWLIANPEGYYNKTKGAKGQRKNTWAIDAFTVTATAGYGRGLDERDEDSTGTRVPRTTTDEFIYTVGGGYTVNFDKAFAGLD